jgi:multiple sugar transport system substrate-binding protein
MKKIVLFIIVAIFSVLAVSCNNSADVGVEDDEVKIITIWTNSRSDVDIRSKQIDRFNKDNSNIKIIYEIKADNYNDLIKIAYQSNNPPDIHNNLSATLTAGAIEEGWLRSLDKEFREEIEKNYLPGTIMPHSNGEYYTIGVGISLKKFIWNKDLFEASGLDPQSPPKTWDEVIEYAKIITAKGNGEKFGFAIPLKDDAFVDYYAMHPGAPSKKMNFGGFEFSEGRYNFSIYKDMIEVLRTLQKDGSVFPSPAILDNDTARAQFSEGNIGMMFAASWDIGVFNDQFPAKIDWGVAEFPTFNGLVEGGGYPAAIGGTPTYMMSAKCKHPDEQLLVMKWLINEENLRELCMEGKAFYTHKSLQNIDVSQIKKKGMELAVPTEPIWYQNYPVSSPTGLIKMEGDGYQSTIKNLIIGNQDVEKTLAELENRYNLALERYEREKGQEKMFKIEGYEATKFDEYIKSLDKSME